MEVKEIFFVTLVGFFVVYALVEIDHFFPFRKILFENVKFIDYEVYSIPEERYYFFYKDDNGVKDKHYVSIDMVSIHSTGKVYVKGYDEKKMQNMRFHVGQMSRLYKDVTYMRIWYPKEYFKRISNVYGHRIRRGQITKDKKES